ncbi:hypothetical protein HMPREF1549_00199 [Actinomyces johnsonii F0510]|uniref:Uncharacterized protein n=1 Tax=Actinomyces johnsonii F0510 TaxID=1227262 RepID=U1QMD8_9ACTO|nr:hypothetical protein HMPREF1549_00199 [Actinomyces johnsonii F0510]
MHSPSFPENAESSEPDDPESTNYEECASVAHHFAHHQETS